jgi:glycosyltransferase involved in cell wall biosynthesis
LSDLRTRAQDAIQGDPWFDDSTDPLFVAAARLTEQKGFDSLIRAFELFRRTRRGRLAIIGRGPLEDALKRQASSAGIGDSVRFLGFQINHLKYIRRATAFVVSSRWEALPMVMGETMALGVPIVSFDCPSGPRELLDHGRCGFLVPDQDVEALATALAFVVDHPEDAIAKAQAALGRVELFDVGRVVRQYEELIERAVVRRRTKAGLAVSAL